MPVLEMLKKQFIAETKVDEKERTLTAIISTTGIDRDDEVIMSRGADLKAFKKNPVVLWAHDYHGTPIGKALWIKRSEDSITAKMKFAETEKAEEIFQLFKGGFLKAFSIGFMPKETHKPTEEEIKQNPKWEGVYRIYDKWELLEFSAVPVPANPEALVAAVNSKALSLSKDTQEELHLEKKWEKTTDTFEFDGEEIENQTSGTCTIHYNFFNDEETEPEAEVKVHSTLKVKEIERVPTVKVINMEVTVKEDYKYSLMAIDADKRAKGIMY